MAQVDLAYISSGLIQYEYLFSYLKKSYISELQVCNCGEAVADGEENTIECNRVGCETQKVSIS